MTNQNRMADLITSNIGVAVLGLVYFLTQYVFNEKDVAIKKLQSDVSLLTIEVSQLKASIQQGMRDRYTATEHDRYATQINREMDLIRGMVSNCVTKDK